MTNDPSSNLTIRVEEVDENASYVGQARPGADEGMPLWQIKKVNTDEGYTTILFANGNDNYLNVWDDRATYTYS